jgi:hypothetical protein
MTSKLRERGSFAAQNSRHILDGALAQTTQKERARHPRLLALSHSTRYPPDATSAASRISFASAVQLLLLGQCSSVTKRLIHESTSLNTPAVEEGVCA